MNYGKNNLTRRKKSISSKKKMKKKRVGVRFFKALLICILLLAVIAVAGVGIFVKKIIDNTPTVTPADVKPNAFTTTVVAESDGSVLEEFKQSGSNRIYKNIDEIPVNLAHAFVAIEDERFYQHNGIDLQGIARAAVVGITSGGNFSEGASTLTQQLIKNNVFPNFVEEKTFYDRLERKIQEQYLAVAIEKQMSKDEILEAYMNTINLGESCLGVQAASKRYFGKDVSELTLSECAVIAGITQNPTEFDPVVYPDQNSKRRDKVLKNMLEQRYITQTEYDEAKADPVYERILPNASEADTTPYSYFNDDLSQQIIKDLMERKAYTETQAYNALYSGGLTITSTQDPAIQQICDEEVANDAVYPVGTEYGLEYALTIYRADGSIENYSKEMLAEYIQNAWGREYPLIFSSPDEANAAINEYKSTLNIAEGENVNESIDITPQPQVSVVVMEQSTGKVKAIVGGRGQKTSSLSLNRATDSTRQPGSCFKVLSTYAPALDSAKYTLASPLKNAGPYVYSNGDKAENWDKVYPGTSTLRYSIEHSINVAALNTITDIGPQTAYDYLLNFGFTTLVNYDNDNYPGMTDVLPSTALGGITRGVYNIELTAAYASIANSGTYIKPILYTKVVDHDGNILLDNSTPDSHQVIKDSTAALLTSAMQDVINKGTGTAARLDGMPAAGKTGTTEKSNDLWLAAYTPYYTASVWGGYDANKPMENIYNQSWHEVLWKNIMTRIHAGLPAKDFTMPSSVQQKSICTQTGYLATSSCPAFTEYFAEGTAPTQSCPGHVTKSTTTTTDTNNTKKSSQDQNSSDNTNSGNVSSDGNTTDNSGGDNSGGDNSVSDNSGGDNSGSDNSSGNPSGGDQTGGDDSGQ